MSRSASSRSGRGRKATSFGISREKHWPAVATRSRRRRSVAPKDGRRGGFNGDEQE